MSKRRSYSSNTPSISFVVFLNHNYAKVVRPFADIFFVGGGPIINTIPLSIDSDFLLYIPTLKLLKSFFIYI